MKVNYDLLHANAISDYEKALQEWRDYRNGNSFGLERKQKLRELHNWKNTLRMRVRKIEQEKNAHMDE